MQSERLPAASSDIDDERRLGAEPVLRIGQGSVVGRPAPVRFTTSPAINLL